MLVEYPDRILHVDVDDLSIMIGNTRNETQEVMPLTHSRTAETVRRRSSTFSVRMYRSCSGKIHIVVISTLLVESPKAVRDMMVSGYCGLGETVPRMERCTSSSRRRCSDRKKVKRIPKGDEGLEGWRGIPHAGDSKGWGDTKSREHNITRLFVCLCPIKNFSLTLLSLKFDKFSRELSKKSTCTSTRKKCVFFNKFPQRL